MGRRRRNLRRSSLAILMLVGLLLAGPASSSGGRERDLRTRPSCASAVVNRLEVTNYSYGTANFWTRDCVGADLGCGAENQM